MAELGQTSDPIALIPGAASDVNAVVTLCERRAGVAQEAARTVGMEKTIDDWTGTAADAYTARATALVTAWSDAQDALSRVATAMRTYSTALSGAQARAGDAIDGWRYAQSLERQEQTQGQASSTFLTPQPGAWPLVFSGGVDMSAPRTSAEGYAKAHGWLADARTWVAEAKTAAVAALNAAAAVLRPDGDSMWASLGASLGAGSVTPASVLSVLRSLRGPQLTTLLAARPDLTRLLAQASPADVSTWWAGLEGDQWNALVHAAPAVIGNLGGVAYSARDEANRILLDQAIDDAEHSPLDKSAQVAALVSLKRSSTGYALISLTLDEPPLAQVGVGNLDAAKNVSFIVPGMNSNVKDDMGDYIHAAQALQYEQQRAGGGDLADYAAIAWLGYHPPMNDAPLDVAFNDKAEAGAPALAKDLTSMAAVHQATGVAVSVSVVAHSYGTDVAALALTQAHADHAVLLGSAGIDNRVDNVADLDVPADQVFASQADHDGWAPVGQGLSHIVGDGRINPTDASFGAQDFSSEAATAPSGQSLHAVDKHGPLGDGASTFSYLNANTTAQYNTALATTGRGGEVIVDAQTDRVGDLGWNGIGAR